MSSTVETGFSRLKKLGQRLMAGQKMNVRAQPIPADVAAERRSGRARTAARRRWGSRSTAICAPPRLS